MKNILDLKYLNGFIDEKAVFDRAAAYAALPSRVRAGLQEYSACTGWLNIDDVCSEAMLARIEAKAKVIQNDADVFIIVGVGGSNNAARSVIEAIRHDGPEIIYAGNSTAPSAMRQVLDKIEGKSAYIDVIAKNFETLEPGAAFRVLRTSKYKHYDDAEKRIITTGTPGGRLHDLSDTYGWDFFEFPERIGGRYSALSCVGLLPMAVAGADIRAVVCGAAEMQNTLLETPGPVNDALLYAAARTLLYEAGYTVETLSVFEPQLSWFTKWWIQLIGESEGKTGRGLFPAACCYSEELHSMGQYMQDGTKCVFETFLNVDDPGEDTALIPDGIDDGFGYLDEKCYSDLNRAACTAAVSAHSEHIPCVQLNMGRLDEHTFGAMFAFFEIACVFSCMITATDPFDQPGVEAYKKAMFTMLGRRN